MFITVIQAMFVQMNIVKFADSISYYLKTVITKVII